MHADLAVACTGFLSILAGVMVKNPASTSVAQICETLGRRAIAERLGRSRSAVTEGIRGGLFPSTWYLTIKAMCAEAGIECPDRLFRFLPDAISRQNLTASAEDAA